MKTLNYVLRTHFLSDLTAADVTQFSKRIQRLQKMTTDQLVFYLIYLKYMKDAFTCKYRLIWMKSYLNINVDFVKGLLHNTA